MLAWAAAAVAAVALSSWGVALVGRSVTDSRPAPLSAAQVEERLAASTATTTTALGGPVTTASAAPGAEPTAPDEAPPTTPADPTAPSGPVPGTVAPATTAPAAPAPTAPPEAAAPPPPAPAGETRTYTMVGGTVSLRFEPSGVTVVFANPAAGFEVQVEPDHVNGVEVEFESEAHRSRVTGWWDGGPQDEREERPDGD